MVLLAICDSRYCFTVVDIGSYGRGSDGSIYSTSRMATEDLKVPPACHVSGIGDMPHVIVGDAAFPLQRNLMRPYPGNELNHEQRIFNYRLSRARREIENAFRILVARWRIFRTPIIARTERVESIVKATLFA
ncbi:Uncharacterised protein at_DN1316 [Pycnogonum litorale]